jgi:hypothetical protein
LISDIKKIYVCMLQNQKVSLVFSSAGIASVDSLTDRQSPTIALQSLGASSSALLEFSRMIEGPDYAHDPDIMKLKREGVKIRAYCKPVTQ